MPKNLISNPFPSPSLLEKVLITELIDVARVCYSRGWCAGTAGNFSLRGSRGLIWQSPSGISKSELSSDAFVAVDVESGHPVEPSARQPSLEMPVHLGVYRAVAEARCVVHAHPPGLVARSRDCLDLLIRGDEMQKALGSINHLQELRLPVIKNYTPEAMPQLATEMVGSLIKDVPLIILAGHGVYAWGDSPLEALSRVEAVEFLCQSAAF